MTAEISVELQDSAAKLKELRSELCRIIYGQESVLDQMLVTLLCGGHALLEGVPGTAKTLAVRTLARTMSCTSKRIQFTPDLMPSDIIGTNVFNFSQSSFELRRGPVFTDLLLADEINRAPAKTQSALLEGMSESHATIDGVRHELSPIFTVFATQNPIEDEGTYPLPAAQQDRFLLKILVDYPAEAAEREILDAVNRGDPPDEKIEKVVQPVFSIDEIVTLRRSLAAVKMDDAIIDYVLKLVRATREHDLIQVGAGPRGSIYLLRAAKAVALLNGRDYTTPDDVLAMVLPVLGHRIMLTAEAEIEGGSTGEILNSITSGLEVPR